MKKNKTILVFGATGSQGGSVARSLLSGKKFDVRIVTRNANSTKAKELQQAGAEVVEGDLGNLDSLIQAMKNCYGVFGVTNYWEHFENEWSLGKNLIDAVQQSGIQHLVLHTLPDYNQLSEGKYPTPHYDIKAALQRYSQQLKQPATYLQLGFYYENFLGFFPLEKTETGAYSFGFPQGDTRLAMVSVEDIGGIVASIFDHPVQYLGRTVMAVGSDENCAEYARLMSKVLKKDIQYKHIPREIYAGLGFPAAKELANMFEVQRLYVPNRLINLIESYGLNPGMLSFEKWLVRNKEKFDFYFASKQSKKEFVS
jgi:uncharacterized protein YbjT (DUF2867 family)